MRHVQLDTLAATDITLLDGDGEQRLSATVPVGAVMPGDVVHYAVQNGALSRRFSGRVANWSSSSLSRVNIVCIGMGQLAATRMVKGIPDHDATAGFSGEVSQGETYKLRIKGVGLTGSVKLDHVLSRIEAGIADECLRLLGRQPVISSPGLDLNLNVVWLIGATFEKFFADEILRAFPTVRYRFADENIVLFDYLTQPVHLIENRKISGNPRLVGNLLGCAANYILESKYVSAVEKTGIAIGAATTQIPVPPYAMNDHHASGITINLKIEYDDEDNPIGTLGEIDSLGLNTNHDAYGIHVIDHQGSPTADIKGGQDRRMRIEKRGEAECLDRFGWDADMAVINDDLGIVSGSGANDVDHTAAMQEIADRQHADVSTPQIAGQVTLNYSATEIMPGHRVRLYQFPMFDFAVMYVSQVEFKDGLTTLTLSTPGADYISATMAQREMNEVRRVFEAQRKVEK